MKKNRKAPRRWMTLLDTATIEFPKVRYGRIKPSDIQFHRGLAVKASKAGLLP